MNNMAEGLYTVDNQGLVTYLNPAAAKMFGWSAAELIGKKMHDITHNLHPDGSPFPAEECSGLQVLTNNVVLRDHEDVFIRKDGSFFRVVVSASPLKWGDQIIGLVVCFRDDTHRRQGEEALRQSEKIYRGIGESIDFGIWICDASGRNIYFQPIFSAVGWFNPGRMFRIGLDPRPSSGRSRRNDFFLGILYSLRNVLGARGPLFANGRALSSCSCQRRSNPQHSRRRPLLGRRRFSTSRTATKRKLSCEKAPVNSPSTRGSSILALTPSLYLIFRVVSPIGTRAPRSFTVGPAMKCVANRFTRSCKPNFLMVSRIFTTPSDSTASGKENWSTSAKMDARLLCSPDGHSLVIWKQIRNRSWKLIST